MRSLIIIHNSATASNTKKYWNLTYALKKLLAVAKDEKVEFGFLNKSFVIWFYINLTILMILNFILNKTKTFILK